MGLPRHARAGRALGVVGSAVLVAAATLALLPAPTVAALAAALTGRPVAASEPAAPHVEQVAGLRWESSRPWTGNKPWVGPDGTGGAGGSGTATTPTRVTARVAAPAGPQSPTPPKDPIPPGPLEPPVGHRWIGGPTPPQCPWPRNDVPAPADWYCQMDPMRSCPQYSGPQVGVLVDAVPAVGSVTLSWWNYGDPDILEWRVAAIEYTQRGSPTPTWQSFTLPVGCYQASHVVTGLESGKRYEFMLEAIEKNHAGRGTALHRGIGHSSLVTIP